MIILDNENCVAFDCDETLIMHSYPKNRESELVELVDCYHPTLATKVLPHAFHIKLLKDYKKRGFTVTVWSAAGYKHALSVVNALDLHDYVDLVMTKYVKFVDDLEAHEVLGTRLYFKDKKKND